MKTRKFLVFLTIMVTALVGFALPFLFSGRDWDPVFWVGLKTVALQMILPTNQHHLIAASVPTSTPIPFSDPTISVTPGPAESLVPVSTARVILEPTAGRRDRRDEDRFMLPVTGPSVQPTNTRRPEATNTQRPQLTNTSVPATNTLGPQPTNTSVPAINTPRPTNTSRPTNTPKPPPTTSVPPTQPQPTEPQPTEPQPTEPQPTEPQPTEPQPTEPQPTEPQPTEPQPTEPPSTEPPAITLFIAI